MRPHVNLATALLAIAQVVQAVPYLVNDTASTKAAAAIIAEGLISYYGGDQPGGIPGLIGGSYYWWECGAMFNSLINYWYYTGDSQYNAIVKEGLLFQASPGLDFMPPNQTQDEGNDDQAFWGYAAMSAAELNFDEPEPDQPQWLALAQGVFNSQAARWDTANCGGGLRWQIWTWNPGYTYKNAPANGGLFHLASRLYAYTGNQTYAMWANKVWDWMQDTGHLISADYQVYDGTTIVDGECPKVDMNRWTYNQGVVLYGAAVMWNMTNSTLWYTRTQGLWNQSHVFFNDEGVMFEFCEIPGSVPCNQDQQSFKAYLSRFMAGATKVAPWLYDQVMPYLYNSSIAAAQQCDGGSNGTECGMKWTQRTQWDGLTGVGEEMAALEVIQSTLIKQATSPVSSKSGGISKGDPNAGTGVNDHPDIVFDEITTSDKVSAGVLTAVMIIFMLSGGYWMA